MFAIKSHVHDLGCNIAYTNAVVLGPLRDKMDNAVAKRNRLRRLHLSLEERAEKIQTAIWPAVFYGALGQTIGTKHFTTLRRAATTVLVGDHKHASSIIATEFLTHKVQDPLLYIVADMLCTLRRLFVYHPDMASQIVTTVRTFTDKVKGPASALASYMKTLGWELTHNATVLGPGGLHLSLHAASTKQIKQQLRKGVPPHPFDSYTTNRILHKLTDRQRRILALSITSGWQSLGCRAAWSATQSPECPWCHQYDTHTHQLIHCPAFQHVRDAHPEAVSHLTEHHYACWFPLPLHHPQIELVRQAMHLRHHNLTIHDHLRLSPNAIIYTDGTCDDTRDPYSARAAWAAILYNAHGSLTQDNPYQVLAAGHCPGPQTINRSELFAMVIAVEYAAIDNHITPVTFVTDSQFVVDSINHIEDGTISNNPHKKSHWDLLNRLTRVWDTCRFTILKIKSHSDISRASSHQEAMHIRGNDMADHVAARVRTTDDPSFDALCKEIRAFRQNQQAIFAKIYMYLLDIAYARMNKLEENSTKPPLHSPDGPLAAAEVDVFAVLGNHEVNPSPFQQSRTV